MFAELYQHLTSRIESIKDNKGESVIRWIDLQSGQLKGANLPPVSFPCALIAFDEVGDFAHNANPVSKGSAFVEIELAFKIVERTHSKATTNAGLVHFSTMEGIVAAIHGTDGEAFDTLWLESVKPESNRQDVRVFTLKFALNAYITTSSVETVDLKSLQKLPDFWSNLKLK